MKSLFSVLAVFLLAGCATVDPKAEAFDLSKQSVVFMSLVGENRYRPDFPIQELFLVVQKEGAGTGAKFAQEVAGDGSDRLGSAFQKTGTPGLVVARIAPGRYTIGRLMGRSKMNANLDFILHGQFEVPSQSVVYLGHVSVVNRQKTSADEQATGMAMLGTAMSGEAGFYSGTLDIALKDHYEADLQAAKAAFKAMSAHPVVRMPIRQLTLESAIGSKAKPRVVTLESMN